MKEPKWLTAEAIRSFHSELLARFGGCDGLRDEGLFDSALNRPKQRFPYEEPSLFELAACYAFGIIKNHPFVDGNKRAGFTCAFVFLFINGYHLKADEAEAAAITLSLAASELDEKMYADWLKENSLKKE